MNHLSKSIRSLVAVAATGAVFTALTASGICMAQTTTPAAATAPATTPAVDPGVIKSLERMGTYLRSLKSFEVDITSLTDEVLDNDQLAQMGSTSKVKVRRPDRMQADISSDRGDRHTLYYNGKTATLYDPQIKYYATMPAPATLRETVAVLEQRYDIQVPVADLFAWGSGEVDTANIKTADFLGIATVDGHLTSHFAIREADIDWQIWIERGKTPVPRKLVITTTSDAAKPQHAILIRWNISPKFAANAFDFKVPAGAKKIVIQTTDGTTEGAK